jgi:hypothetical protein
MGSDVEQALSQSRAQKHKEKLSLAPRELYDLRHKFDFLCLPSSTIFFF